MGRLATIRAACAAVVGLVALSCGSTRAAPAAGSTDEHVLVARGDARPAVTPASAPGHSTGAPASVRWCASGGAPIVGAPVVDEKERSYVATSDGYLHAFERDGRFRWSYTVKGTPLGSVSLRPSDGAILMGTTGRYIYAINQDGSLRFRFPTLTPVWSGLLALNPSTVVFLGHDRRIYALGNNGTRRYRVRAPSDPMGGPVVAPDDVVWLPLEDGVARFQAAYKLERFELPVPVEQVVPLGRDVVALGGGEAFFVSKTGQVGRLGRARMLAGDGQRVVLVRLAGTLELLTSELSTEHVAQGATARAPLSAPPTLVGEHVWLPYQDGTVQIVALRGKGESIEFAAHDGPVSSPVVGPSGRFAIVPTPGGRFCAVELGPSVDLP